MHGFVVASAELGRENGRLCRVDENAARWSGQAGDCLAMRDCGNAPARRHTGIQRI